MLTPIYIDVGVLMGAIMAAGFKRRIEAWKHTITQRLHENILPQRRNINLLTPKQSIYQRFSFMNQ